MFSSPSSAGASRSTLGAACLGGLLVIGAVLSACSSGSSNSASSSTSAAGATTTTTAAPGSGSAGSGSSDSARIQSLSSAVQAGKHATFKASYTSHNVSGSSETLTIEQEPPKSVFSTGGTSIIDDGTHTYFCSAASGTQTCVSESGAGANPLASIAAIFDPATLQSEFQAAEAAAAAHSAGYSLAFSDSTYAGLAAKCVNFTHTSQTVKYCVTNSGILAYAASGGSTFELTGFSSSPADSDFSVPAGATVVTVPNVSVPSTP